MKYKKVGVIGLGRSGLAAAQLLKNKKIDIEVSDCLDTQEIREKAELLKGQGIKVEVGRHSPEFIQNKDLIVVSPGADNPLISLWAKQKNIPLISEIELGYYFCRAPIIAISGTNGKTTTAILIGSLLKNSASRVVVCGNIGTPFSQIILENNYEIIILEVSSFQLEKIDKFKPYISIILNITPDHLDRYKTFEEYRRTKYRIFENQSEGDWMIVNRSCVFPVARVGRTKHAVNLPSEQIAARCSPSLSRSLRSLEPCPLGLRNGFLATQPEPSRTNSVPRILYLDKGNENEQAVRLVGEILKIKKEIVDRTLKEFKGLEHRLEYVGTIRGIRFINDSKATNVDSVRYALQKISPPVVLILGGRDKGGDFGVLRPLIKEKVKELILIGEAKEKIKEALKGIKAIDEADSLEEAFNFAQQAAEKGDTVLLSPGCASFDMFANFEARGKEFKRLVFR